MMDLLLPVFQLVYFVSHFLYSLAQSVVLTWHLLTTMVPLHRLRPHYAVTHPLPDNGMGLAKTPRHLGIVLGLTSPSVASVAALVAHAASYGVRYVSVYDIVGDLQLRKCEVMKHVRKAAGSVYNFRESGESGNEAETVVETSVCGSSVDGAVGDSRHRNSKESSVMEGVQKAVGSDGECEKTKERKKCGKEQEFEQKSCENLTSESGRAETCPGNSGKVPETSPKLLDNRPVVTVQFLGLKDGRQKLASTAEKLARKHAGEVCVEGSADSNFVDSRNVGGSSERDGKGSDSSPYQSGMLQNFASGGEKSAGGLRKRIACVAESSESPQSSENPSLYELKTPENLATSVESSETELVKEKKCSFGSPEKSGTKSESCPPKFKLSEGESSMYQLRNHSLEGVESFKGGGSSSENPSYSSKSWDETFLPELRGEGDNSMLEGLESLDNVYSVRKSPERCSGRLRTFENLPDGGKSHLRIVPHSSQNRDNINNSSLGLRRETPSIPTHSIDLPSSLDSPENHPNQSQAKISDDSSRPERGDLSEISPKLTETSNISLHSSVGLYKGSGHIHTHPIGLPTALDITGEVSLGLPDPELLITLGLNSTLGYPPWLLRTSEIHSMDASEGVVGLRKVMEAYAGCEQRWGT